MKSQTQTAAGHRGFYGVTEVLEKLPVSRATLYRRIKEGDFPRAVRISKNRVGWLKDAVDERLDKLARAAA
jgi:prophage regulatory protein